MTPGFDVEIDARYSWPPTAATVAAVLTVLELIEPPDSTA